MTPSQESLFLTVVIPAFNEEKNLFPSVMALIEKLSTSVPSFELLVVDDASHDRTGAIADQLASSDPRVRVFHHPQNRGIGAGFVTGVRNARGEWFMLIPADLAMDLDELRKYFNAARNADVVVGLRSDKSDYTILRRLVSWSNIMLVRLLFGMRERQFQYISLYRTWILQEMDIEFSSSAFFWPEILIKAKSKGHRLTEVEIHYIPRQCGQATGADPKLILLTVRDMIYFWLRGDWRTKR
jgi:glycosyltransferase involved in cell wall biosynthesis